MLKRALGSLIKDLGEEIIRAEDKRIEQHLSCHYPAEPTQIIKVGLTNELKVDGNIILRGNENSLETVEIKV